MMILKKIKIVAFFQKYSDSFLFLGLSFLPVVSVIRGCFTHSNPSVKFVVNTILLIVTLILFVLVFCVPQLEKFLIDTFVRVLNTKIAQSLLFFFLWVEQISILHIIAAAGMYIPLGLLYAIAFRDYPLLWIFLQILLVGWLLFLRARRTILNE